MNPPSKLALDCSWPIFLRQRRDRHRARLSLASEPATRNSAAHLYTRWKRPPCAQIHARVAASAGRGSRYLSAPPPRHPFHPVGRAGTRAGTLATCPTTIPAFSGTCHARALGAGATSAPPAARARRRPPPGPRGPEAARQSPPHARPDEPSPPRRGVPKPPPPSRAQPPGHRAQRPRASAPHRPRGRRSRALTRSGTPSGWRARSPKWA